jgi:hypothetical protein
MVGGWSPGIDSAGRGFYGKPRIIMDCCATNGGEMMELPAESRAVSTVCPRSQEKQGVFCSSITE